MKIRQNSIAVFGLLAILVWSGQALGQEAVPAIREHRIPFQVRDGLIYVQARVNGGRGTLLVDTGAVLSTFTLKLVPTLNTDSRISINLAKGSASAFRLPVEVALGESDSRERRCIFRLQAVVGDFKFLEADGLLGQDVLSLFKTVTFDFKNSMLILEDR